MFSCRLHGPAQVKIKGRSERSDPHRHRGGRPAVLCPAGAVHRRVRQRDRTGLPGHPLRQRRGPGGAVQAGV